jgi:hypothetical protein
MTSVEPCSNVYMAVEESQIPNCSNGLLEDGARDVLDPFVALGRLDHRYRWCYALAEKWRSEQTSPKFIPEVVGTRPWRRLGFSADSSQVGDQGGRQRNLLPSNATRYGPHHHVLRPRRGPAAVKFHVRDEDGFVVRLGPKHRHGAAIFSRYGGLPSGQRRLILRVQRSRAG